MRIMTQRSDSYEEHIENIPIVSNYKYLGIIFDELINFNAHIKHVKEKVEKRAKLLKKMMLEYTLSTRIILWQSLIRSILEYS